MLQVFRESFGRYVAIAILALIGVTFIFFGIDFTTTQASYAAKVNGESIPIRDFEQELQDLVNQYQRELRIELSDDDRLALRRQTIERMVLREVLLQQAIESGYRVSNARVDQDILSTPAFQVGGRYSEDVGRSLLAAQGLTPSAYRVLRRNEMTMLEFQDGLLESGFITPAEFRRFIEIYYESREVGYAQFSAASFADSVEIEDAEIAEYYVNNESRFMTAETVDIEYISLNLAQVAATVEISDARLREYYDEEAARFAGSEQRHVRHILIEIGDGDSSAALAEAEALRERLDAGEDFAALAAEASDDVGSRNSGGDLGFVARGVLGGALEEALFSMEQGAIAGPVESEFGYHLIRLDGVRAGEQRPFELVREEIRSELASSEAYDSFIDQARALADAAFQAGTDLASVARDFELPLETINGLTRDGGIDRFANPAPIVAAAFDANAIASGESSDLIELGDDRIAILRVTAHHLPELQPQEAVEAGIRAGLLAEKSREFAVDAAAAFAAELDAAAVAAGTQDPVALAAAHGGSWNERISVDRTNTELPSAMISTIFAQARPVAGEPVVTNVPIGIDDEAVIVVFSAAAGVPDDIPSAAREQGREQLIRQLTEAELNAYVAAARAQAKVRIPDEVLNPDL